MHHSLLRLELCGCRSVSVTILTPVHHWKDLQQVWIMWTAVCAWEDKVHRELNVLLINNNNSSVVVYSLCLFCWTESLASSCFPAVCSESCVNGMWPYYRCAVNLSHAHQSHLYTHEPLKPRCKSSSRESHANDLLITTRDAASCTELGGEEAAHAVY